MGGKGIVTIKKKIQNYLTLPLKAIVLSSREIYWPAVYLSLKFFDTFQEEASLLLNDHG